MSVSADVGVGAAFTSASLKTADALAFNGSKSALIRQWSKLGINFIAGKLIRGVAGKMVTRTSSSVPNTLFRSSSTGQFVTNTYGTSIAVAADATNVSINQAACSFLNSSSSLTYQQDEDDWLKSEGF